MENKTFNLGGMEIVLDEQDYVSAVIFEKLYSKVNLELYMYEKYLEKVLQFDTGSVKRCLRIVQSSEIIDNSLSELISNMEEFVWGEKLEEICEEIKSCFNINYLRTCFSENSIIFSSFDFDECVEQGADRLLKSTYEERVANNENTIRGLSFEEYKKTVSFKTPEDIIEAYRVGEEVELMGESNFITKYENLIPVTDDNLFGLSALDVKKMCQVILQLKNLDYRKQLVEDFRQECLLNILWIMRDLKYKFNIPLQVNYFLKRNYEKYISIYKAQLSKEEQFCQNKLIIENLTRFPFLDKQYRIVLNAVGDSNKDLEQYANFFSIDLIHIKKEEFERFVESNIKINMEDEKQVQTAYDRIIQYRTFIGYDNAKNDVEQKLKSLLEEFDIKYRTVNGILYSTRKEADEIRSRSFEGKEYASKEQAELVKREVELIRQVGTYPRTVEKYRGYKELMSRKWQTEESSIELKKLDGTIRNEYQEMCRKSEEVNSTESKFKITGVTGIVVTLLCFLYDSFIGVVALIISLIVIYVKYNKMADCKKASQELIEMNEELGKKKTIDLKEATSLSGNNKKCPRCGSEIADDMKFCIKCGLDLRENDKK